MTPRILSSYCLIIAALLVPRAALAQGARLQLDHLNKLAEKATETVDVSADTAMLKQAAGFLAGKGSDTEKMQQLLGGITGIYVKSFEFDAPNMYAESDVEAIRKQVSGSGWSRVVSVREKGELTRDLFLEGPGHDWRPRRDIRRSQRVDGGQHRRSRRSRLARSAGTDDPENAGRTGQGHTEIATSL